MIHALKKVLAPAPTRVSDGRKSARYSFSEPCQVERWGRSFHAMARNISKGGMCLDIVGMGSSALDADLTILMRDFEPITATARWSHKRTFGLQFLTDSADHPQLKEMIAALEAAH